LDTFGGFLDIGSVAIVNDSVCVFVVGSHDEVSGMGLDTQMDESEQVGASVGNLITISNVVSMVNITLVENFHHVTTKETLVSEDSSEESSSSIITLGAKAFFQELLFVSTLERGADVSVVGVHLASGLLNGELVTGVLGVASRLVDGVEDLVEVVLHVLLEGINLIGQILDSIKNLLSVGLGEEFNKLSNDTNDAEKRIHCLKDFELGCKRISDFENAVLNLNSLGESIQCVSRLLGLIQLSLLLRSRGVGIDSCYSQSGGHSLGIAEHSK